MPPVTKICPICSTEFQVKPYKAQKLCSCSVACDRERRHLISLSWQERFWDKVLKTQDGCWIWQAGRRGNYGCFRKLGKNEKAHKIAYELCNGPIPELPKTDYHGICVLHKCDTPLCCNPVHLFLGSIKDNHRDMDKKGRRRGRERLDGMQTHNVQTLYSTGRYTQQELASFFQIDQTTVSLICLRKTRRKEAQCQTSL